MGIDDAAADVDDDASPVAAAAIVDEDETAFTPQSCCIICFKSPSNLSIVMVNILDVFPQERKNITDGSR